MGILLYPFLFISFIISYSTEIKWNSNVNSLGFRECARQKGKDSDVHLADFTRQNLEDLKIFPWFKPAYDSYKPDPNTIDSLSYIKQNIKIIVFGGSWCSDTKKLLPAFYKSVEMAGISPQRINLIGVNRKKKSNGRFSRHYRIKKVPTFILFYNEKEIGRIVETVNQSIETDMLKLYDPYLKSINDK